MDGRVGTACARTDKEGEAGAANGANAQQREEWPPVEEAATNVKRGGREAKHDRYHQHQAENRLSLPPEPLNQVQQLQQHLHQNQQCQRVWGVSMRVSGERLAGTGREPLSRVGRQSHCTELAWQKCEWVPSEGTRSLF